jgi:UDP-N-acetylglucosamine 2-epimerase (non-hydrolysing)
MGTRPEAIKMAPVILGLQRQPGIRCHVCVTGQHRQMLQQVMDVFELTADTDLELMQPNQTLASLTSRAIQKIDEYLKAEKPDLVLVQGDTTTVFCAALCAFYSRVPLGHVEAGLRTGDLNAPWPEEANRVLTTRLTALHFAPTPTARENLLREHILPENIHVTGNTVIDTLFLALEKIKLQPPTVPGLPPDWNKEWQNRPMVLVTGHRRENFGQGFEAICLSIVELADKFPDVCFVYPVHLNPNVREPVERIVRSGHRKNIFLIEPLSYLPFVLLMNRASIILTDSGGVQEEAPSLGKPVLVMRETTERPEAVSAGTVKLVGTDQSKIVGETSRLLNDKTAYAAMARSHNPYGDGLATGRIIQACRNFLKL